MKLLVWKSSIKEEYRNFVSDYPIGGTCCLHISDEEHLFLKLKYKLQSHDGIITLASQSDRIDREIALIDFLMESRSK